MFPLGVDNPTFRPPIVTFALLALLALAWVAVQGAGLDPATLAASVCNLGMVPGELTRLTPVGTAVPLGPGMTCVVDAQPINWLTPVSSMFLHGGWAHLLGNALFLWVFARNVEDSMGRVRFPIFYLLTGLAAAAAQVAIDPSSAVPVVGASGAISGVMGAYLVLYPTARVRMLVVFFVFIRVLRVPAWVVLVYWLALQVIAALPMVAGAQQQVPTGVAVMAHIGGFAAGAALGRLFSKRAWVEQHRALMPPNQRNGPPLER